MAFRSVQKIADGAYFVVDTTGYFNQITPLDLVIATQTISGTPRDLETPEEEERAPEREPEAK